MMYDELRALTERFGKSLSYYKDTRNAYNEHSTRIEYIDPLLKLLGWDVSNEKGLQPQYREVIAENYVSRTERPDYSLSLRGVTKLFVEAKKPSVDISLESAPAIQARKYGWNAGHKITILTNFEYLILYDTTAVPYEHDNASTARYRMYHYTEYVAKFEEISSLISRDAVYSGAFDEYFNEHFPDSKNRTQPVDKYFLAQINEWRLSLSNELYQKGGRYSDLNVLNDVIQEFINQIVFLRICEDKNLPLYHNLKETITDADNLHTELERLLRSADRRYNSGIFKEDGIISDLSSRVISSMIEGLYYPQSPYVFSVIEPNMLGKIYEMFLTEQLVLENDHIVLGKKKDCRNRSVVTTPTEIVKYMIEKTLSPLCDGKTPNELKKLRIGDIACGSGIYLEAVFDFLQSYCVSWYLENDPGHLVETGAGRYKLSLEEKKDILTSCIFGVDIDVHAVEVSKFSLLIKLIEEETTPSVVDSVPILPALDRNIFFGNSLVGPDEIRGMQVPSEDIVTLSAFDWRDMCLEEGFDAIVGNPPYVSTEDMHGLLPDVEFMIYKKCYQSAYKQFDKYFLFLERALKGVKDGGYVCYIIPNKFFKVGAGTKLRKLISTSTCLVSLDDFGDAQLFEDKTIYSSIVLLQKRPQQEFIYTKVTNATNLWSGKVGDSIRMRSSTLNDLPWRLTTDFDFLRMINAMDAVSAPVATYAEIFNGIQTSAERPEPVYWFTSDMVISEDESSVEIVKDGNRYHIERSILRPYFKPTAQKEKGLNTYSPLVTDKMIIFPYDKYGQLYPMDVMKSLYPGAYAYLYAYYERLVPRSVSPTGTRDVQNATAETWYQYGRTQALTSFTDTPKLIVGVLSKEPMYAYDNRDMLIASGGTAGYVAISKKADSPYALEYIQAWLTHPYTEQLIRIVGSDFEGGFIARGTYVLSSLPFVKLDLTDQKQNILYQRVVQCTNEIYALNDAMMQQPDKRTEIVMKRRKEELRLEIESIIGRIYRLEF